MYMAWNLRAWHLMVFSSTTAPPPSLFGGACRQDERQLAQCANVGVGAPALGRLQGARDEEEVETSAPEAKGPPQRREDKERAALHSTVHKQGYSRFTGASPACADRAVWRSCYPRSARSDAEVLELARSQISSVIDCSSLLKQRWWWGQAATLPRTECAGLAISRYPVRVAPRPQGAALAAATSTTFLS